MRLFEKVSKYANDDSIILPTRATDGSGGYDFRTSEDIILPSYSGQMNALAKLYAANDHAPWEEPMGLDEVAEMTKGNRPTLVPTGIKCNIPKNEYLQLSVRSSGPLKTWIILGNGIGLIDSDYYNNPSNEGEIFFQLINLLPFPIKIKKGDKIGQGTILHYEIVDNDVPDSMTRKGGFGSTNG